MACNTQILLSLFLVFFGSLNHVLVSNNTLRGCGTVQRHEESCYLFNSTFFWAGNSDIHLQVPMQRPRICITGMLPSLVLPGIFQPFQLHGLLLLPHFWPRGQNPRRHHCIPRVYLTNYLQWYKVHILDEISSWLK